MNDSFQPNFNLSNIEILKIQSFRDIRQVKGLSFGQRCVGVPVTGDTLKHLGIFHGDILVVKLTKKFAEKNLCVWETPEGRTAKFAYENFGEIVLHNQADWKQTWSINQIKCLGIVVRVERDLEVSQ